MNKTTLTVSKRTLTGRKVKRLRIAGKIPGNVFGKKTKSLAVEMDAEALTKVFKKGGETSLLDLAVDGETRPVLVQNIQTHPVSGKVLHVDFRQVDLKEKVKAKVLLQVLGEAPAVLEKLGVLLTLLDELEVEALPTDLPEKITVDLSSLTKLHDSVKVKDLKLPQGVIALQDGEIEIVTIGDLVTKEAEKLVAEEEAAKAAAAVEAATVTPEVVTPIAAPEETKPAEPAKAEK